MIQNREATKHGDSPVIVGVPAMSTATAQAAPRNVPYA